MNLVLERDKARVWVFAQSDRAQREVFLEEMNKKHQALCWQPVDSCQMLDRLWLCDVDEIAAIYR